MVGAGEDDFATTNECGSAEGWDSVDGDVTTTWNGSGNAFADDDHSDAADANAAEVKASVAAAAAFDGNSGANAGLGLEDTEAIVGRIGESGSHSGWGGAGGDDAPVTCNHAGTADFTAAVDIGTFAAAAITLGSGTTDSGTELEGPGVTDKDAASTG